MTRASVATDQSKPSDLIIRQKVETMLAYGYVALRQFPKDAVGLRRSLLRGWPPGPAKPV